MQERIIFREMLSEVKELADTRGNKLTVEEVKEFFQNAHLNEEQMRLIYEYLVSQKVKVEGYESQVSPNKEEPKEDVQEIHSMSEPVSMYQEELGEIPVVSEEEELKLFEAAHQGDAQAKSRLVELHLQMVCDVAQTYQMGDLPLGDLIQEGNIALLLAMEELASIQGLEEYRSLLYEKVSAAMEDVMTEHQDLKDMDEKIAQRANHLNEAVANLERDLEHKVSLEELSAYLEMSEKEIQDILRMAGNEIELLDENGTDETPPGIQ